MKQPAISTVTIAVDADILGLDENEFPGDIKVTCEITSDEGYYEVDPSFATHNDINITDLVDYDLADIDEIVDRALTAFHTARDLYEPK